MVYRFPHFQQIYSIFYIENYCIIQTIFQMKQNNYNKNSKQSSQYRLHGSGNKRTASPLDQNNYAQSKKSNSHKKIAEQSPYQKVIKDFESYSKSTKRKAQQIPTNLRQQKQKANSNKFRIVTEPVDDRIMHLAQGNIFNSSSMAVRNASNYNMNSRKKIETQIAQGSHILRVNLRQNSSQSRSRDKVYSSKNLYLGTNNKSGSYKKQAQQSFTQNNKCRNCIRYAEQLQYLQNQIKKIIKQISKWKSGDAAYDQIKHYFLQQSKNKQRSQLKVNKGSNQFLFADSIMRDMKSNMIDMIKDIQSLSAIDYPQMLAMDIFMYQPMYYEGVPDTQQAELTDLIGQLRNTMEGKTIDYDTYDSDSQNSYTKMIMRNMKARLGHALRQNLEIKIKIAILQKSEQISQQSQEYLRMVIEEVISNYCKKKV